MEHIYRKLVKSFSKIKGFDGWMIAKAEFKIEELKTDRDKDIQTENIEFIRQRRNYSAVISRTIYNGMEYMLIMHIIKPYSSSLAENPVINPDGNYLFTLKYTKEDIKWFVHNSGDSNYIHQTDRPVVPGFLVFEDILGKLFFGQMCKRSTDFKIEKCTIIFRTPAFADEAIDVFKTDNGKFRLMLGEKGAVYGECIYNRRS